MPPCPRCSTENAPGNAACVRCGSPLAQAPGAPYGQAPHAQPPQPQYGQPPQPQYGQPPQPQFGQPPQPQYGQPPQPQYGQPPQPQYGQPPQPQYGQPPQPQFGQPAAPMAPPMGAPGQPMAGVPGMVQQPMGLPPGGGAPGGDGDADPDRPLKLGGFPSKFGAAFCYAPICACFPPLYAVVALTAEDKQNKFVRFHAMQAIIVWVGLIAFSIISFVLQLLAGFLIVAVGGGLVGNIISWGLMAILGLIGLGFTAALIAGVVLSIMGKPYQFPLIGGFAAKHVQL